MKYTSIFFIFCVHMQLHLFGNDQNVSTAAEEYESEFIALIEMVYGEGLLSQGGVESIDQMFDEIDLDGMKMLDLGSGLGMYDIHLAKHHQINIIGIDPQGSLVQQANHHLELAKNDLVGSVTFQKMNDPNNLNEFLDHTFDIIYSKEALLHVPLDVKQAYFNEVYRVLKPGGMILIMDWMHDGPNYSANTIKMIEMDGLHFHMLTPLEYANMLDVAGFDKIELLDTTEEHARFSRQNINTILGLEAEIKQRFGKETFDYSIESWGYQEEAFKNRELLTGVFTATKN